MNIRLPDIQGVCLRLSSIGKRLPDHLPAWLKSSAIQQGLMFGVVSIISLVLMASVTFLYVDYELGKQNREIVQESRELVREQHRDFNDIDEMLSRLEGSVTAMRDISANIAHELKTPITRLCHNLLTLRDEAGQLHTSRDKDFFRQLDHALEDSQRLTSIFDALLRITQIESGARRSRFTRIDLAQIVDTVTEIYQDVAEDARMTMYVVKKDAPVIIQGDRELLIQQFASLIENALRYCPAGSRITLGCGLDKEDGIAWLKVADNGPGIVDEEKERVFERLYRVDKSRTDGGLGLGLSLAKAVAGLHHGSIALSDCMPGLGVKVSIPVDESTAALQAV
ncbi:MULTISPECIES: sensor histidine kinase [unclassified Endozoicomonas]|uniref:sensor histidine kinase n=1 Tax=unclassified Endozoicomonas TaxID=2644528 RepID=UPI003BB723A5